MMSTGPDNPSSAAGRGHLASIVKGGVTSFSGKIAGGAITYATSLLMARILGAADFGLFFLGFSIVRFCSNLVTLGMDNSVVRYVPIYQADGSMAKLKGLLRQCLAIPAASGLVVCGALLIAAGPASAHFFHKPELTPVIQALAVALPFFPVMMVASFATRGFQTMKYSVLIVSYVQPAVNLLLILSALILFHSRLGGVLLAYPVSVIVGALLAVHFLRRLTPVLDAPVKPEYDTRGLLAYSVPTFASGFLVVIMVSMDTIMLGYFGNCRDVGIYNAAARTSMLAGVIGSSFAGIFAPVISKLYHRRELEELATVFRTVARWNFAVSVPLFIFIAFFSHSIMALFGSEFTEGRTVLIFLAFAQMIAAATGFTGGMLLMSGRQNVMFWNSAGMCAANAALNLLLIPIYSALGAAIATATTIIVYNALMLAEVYVVFRVLPFGSGYFKVIIAGLLPALLLLFLKWHIPVAVPLFLLVGGLAGVYAVLFGLLMWALRFSAEDKLLIGFLKQTLREKQSGEAGTGG